MDPQTMEEVQEMFLETMDLQTMEEVQEMFLETMDLQTMEEVQKMFLETMDLQTMEEDQILCRVLSLPVELFALILCKLPLQKLFQLRCVCTTWRDYLTEDHCLQYFFQMSSQTPLYTVSLKNECFAAYSSEINSWHKWTSALHSKYFSRFKVHGEFGDWLLVEDASGVKVGTLPSLCLADTRKKSQNQLPREAETKHWRIGKEGNYLAVGLIPGGSPKSYKDFVVISSEGPQLGDNLRPDPRWTWWYNLYWYDFDLDSWKASWVYEKEERKDVSSITLYEGVLHCIIHKTKRGRHRETKHTRVYRYCEGLYGWKALSAQISGKLLHRNYHEQFEWEGHLMLIDGRGQYNKFRLAGVHIWQLEKESNVWVESTRMPGHILEQVYMSDILLRPGSRSRSSVCYQICGHRICVTITGHDRDSESFGCKHVMCDLSTTLWWVLPEPSFPGPAYYENIGCSYLTPCSVSLQRKLCEREREAKEKEC